MRYGIAEIKSCTALDVVFECVGYYAFSVFSVKWAVVILMNIYACAADVVFNKYRLTFCVNSYILGSNAEHGHMHVAAHDGLQCLIKIRHKAFAENKAVWVNVVSFAFFACIRSR